MLTATQEKEAIHAMQSIGLIVETIDYCGTIQRIPTIDKPTSKNGWYTAYGDGVPTIVYGNWASETKQTWTAKRFSTMSKEERKQHYIRIGEAKAQRETEQAERHKNAMAKASDIYAKAIDCTCHSYLERKGIKSVKGLKVSTNFNYDSLIVPLTNANNQLVGLQFIPASEDRKDKPYLSGTNKNGAFFSIETDPDKDLVICEGVATGISIYECTGLPVLVAFDAGNLLSVARVARDLYPNRKIIMAADNDKPSDQYQFKGGIGVAKATEAAFAIDGFIAIPQYQGLKVDWNDLHFKMGSGDVIIQFNNHKKPEPLTNSPTPVSEKLPYGYFIRTTGKQKGLWHKQTKEDTDPIETWLGDPLYVLGHTEDKEGKATGLWLEWLDRRGRIHNWAMPLSLVYGRDPSAWQIRLIDEGWRCATGNRVRQLIGNYLASYDSNKIILCVSCTGWHDGNFVFPDMTYSKAIENTDQSSTAINAQIDKIVLQVPTSYNPFKQLGTLEGWQDTIGKWAIGNSRIQLALCASLASTLLEMTIGESGGFNWMGQSSTGKTTALVAAGSLWGRGTSSNGYIQSWRATDNGLEGLAALHSDTALCLDEIGQAPAKTIEQSSYMLANGTGKTRSDQSGNTKLAKSWRCMVLSTGEKGLAEKLAEDGAKVQAGQLVRLIDIPADAGANMGIFEHLHEHQTPQALAEAMKKAAATDYGHIAKLFIQEVQKDYDSITKKVAKLLDLSPQIFAYSVDAHPQIGRVAKRFALCVAAGELAIEKGLFPWEAESALNAIKTCFNAWLEMRGGYASAEDDAILSQIKLFIEQHGASRFQDMDNMLMVCPNRVGFKRSIGEDTEFYVLTESFKKEVCKGVSSKRAISLLYDKGWLIPEGTSKSKKLPKDINGVGRPRCYLITSKILVN